MRVDKLAALRQKLRRGADAFEFGALIDGVSTIEESREAKEKAPTPASVEEPVAKSWSAPAAKPVAEPIARTVPAVAPATKPAIAPTPAPVIPVPAPVVSAPVVEAKAPAAPPPPRREEPRYPPPPPPEPNLSLEMAVQPGPPPTRGVAHPVAARVAPSRLRGALEQLSQRLLQECGRLSHAVERQDAGQAGESLSAVNQVLELLHSIDPTGDVARQQAVAAAPPEGRTWPRAAWSYSEFCQSPLSGLLPTATTGEFVRGMFYSAWGVARG